jgi:protein SCO1/2
LFLDARPHNPGGRYGPAASWSRTLTSLNLRASIFRTSTLLLFLSLGGCQSGPALRGTPVEPPEAAPEIVALNWDGEEFRLSSLRGRVAILFFGYASCPDVCPLTLSRMKQLYGKLGERAADVAIVFISVDPQRDSVDRLGGYVPAFDERFYGLFLEGESLNRTTESYDVVVEKHRPKAPGGFYAVDHTGTLFVIDPEGMLRVQHPHNAAVEDLHADVLALLEGSPS